MSRQNHTTPRRGLRARLGTLLRDSRWLIALELAVAFAILAAHLAGLMPLSEIPALLALGWLSLWARGVGWRCVGLKRPASWARALAVGAAVGAGLQFFIAYVLEPLVVRLMRQPVDLSQFAAVRGNLVVLGILLLLVWTLAAFGEEMVYRGYLMNRVAGLAGGGKGAWALSLVVVSLLFGVGHLYQGAPGVVVNVAAGLVYGAVYLWAGRNLWAPIITHGVYDTAGLTLLYYGL